MKNTSNYRDYKKWLPIKEEIQTRGTLHKFKNWELWWCAVGENVGMEINGKGERFARPVVVFHKFSRYGFMGIPLTTKDHRKHSPDWYIHFKFKGKDQFAALHQIENISTFRLYRKMGELDDTDIRIIKRGFINLYL